jgi:hypothetical protein
VGISETRAIGKLEFGRDPAVDTNSLVDQGILTMFSTAQADV